MTRSPLRLAASAFLFAAAIFIPAIVQAQPGGSSAREIQTEVQKTDPRVDQIIERANDHFRKGKLNLEDNKREQARDEFDKAVDEILMSGLDVRASQRLQTFYLELVEKVYREEVPLMNCHKPEAAAHDRAFGLQALSTCPSQVMSSGTPSRRKVSRAIFIYRPDRRRPASMVRRPTGPW